MKTTREKHFENYDVMLAVFGELDENISRITQSFDVDIFATGNSVKISGDSHAVEGAMRALDALEGMADKGDLIPSQVGMAIDCAKAGKELDLSELMNTVAITVRGKIVRPKTFGQKRYIDAIRRNGIVFGVGPAGTGKTYLAVALAVGALKNNEVGRIILTRPAVEAGEKLGFLPGDLSEKVDPYLRPLFDALKEFLGEDTYLRFIERGVIEIAPLAYMRGRTLSNCFVILDEAQNTTREQMKMFLTRMGENCRMVVTGDISQIDLPRNVTSGLVNAIEVLRDVKGVEIDLLTSKDVIRNELVTHIVEAYERYEEAEQNGKQ